MEKVKNVIIFIMFVIICSCNSPTENSSSPNISIGTYKFDDPRYCSIMIFTESNNVKEVIIDGDISSECTTSIVIGTYEIDNSTYTMYCESYTSRDSCDLPWDNYDYISGRSFPIRNITIKSFELKVDVYWYKYSKN